MQPPASHLPPAVFSLSLSVSLSPLRPSFFALRSLCHREHKLFSHWPRRLNDWCVQTTRVREGMTCSPDPSPSPASATLRTPDMSVLASIPHNHPPSSLTCFFFFFFCTRWGYTSRCPGNPGPAHYSAPLRHSSLEIRAAGDAALLRIHRSSH